MRLSRYTVVSEPVCDKDTGAAYRIVFSTRSLEVFAASAGLWEIVEAGELERLPAGMTERLHNAEILVAEEEDELSAVLARSRDAIADATTLYECIQPTAACQLGCNYCGQRHSATKLSEKHQDELVERIDGRLSGCRKLDICWFGAEPLLGLSILRRLTHRLRDVALLHDCEYQARVVTNGMLLTPEVARELVRELDVREIEVTLDGPPAAHDSRRHTKAGAPTFETIFTNLLALVRDDTLRVQWVVRCNVDRRNVEHVPEFVEMLAAARLQGRISVYFAPIHDWGNGADSLAVPADDYAALEVDWLALLALRGFAAPFLPGAKPIVCMAVNPRAELIDPSGDLYNCTEVPLVPSYGKENAYSMGGLANPHSSPSARRLAGFLDDVEQRQFPCASCPMLPVCGGACPKQWYEGRVPCPSTKRNMKERLILAWALNRIGAPVLGSSDVSDVYDPHTTGFTELGQSG